MGSNTELLETRHLTPPKHSLTQRWGPPTQKSWNWVVLQAALFMDFLHSLGFQTKNGSNIFLYGAFWPISSIKGVLYIVPKASCLQLGAESKGVRGPGIILSGQLTTWPKWILPFCRAYISINNVGLLPGIQTSKSVISQKYIYPFETVASNRSFTSGYFSHPAIGSTIKLISRLEQIKR